MLSFVLLANKKNVILKYASTIIFVVRCLFSPQMPSKISKAFDFKKYTQTKEVPILATSINFVPSAYKEQKISK